MKRDLVRSINALLPQTQCTKCGYEGCRPYAHAIAIGKAVEVEERRCQAQADVGRQRVAVVQIAVRVVPQSPGRGVVDHAVVGIVAALVGTVMVARDLTVHGDGAARGAVDVEG